MGLTGSPHPELVMQRRQQLANQVGYDADRALLTVQEHGANVVTFHRRRAEGGQCVLSTDALATDLSGQAILTYHADCYPLLFVDRTRGVVAGAHAGWRGLLAGVAIQTVRALHLGYGTRPVQLDVLIGPGICARCYPVGPEVAEQFQGRLGRSGRYLEELDDGIRLDLEGIVRLQLEDEGVAPDRIQAAGWCTREDHRWFSHRGGRPGRFLSAVVAP
jgi:purine-nucleoside/S-methyl-5'-thioadenosine phosphorylase / adenosine deaminase